MPALVQWSPPTPPLPHTHATLQHLLHNLCCDWQASINLARLCSIIISPAIQLDSAHSKPLGIVRLHKGNSQWAGRAVACSFNESFMGVLVNTTPNTMPLINMRYPAVGAASRGCGFKKKECLISRPRFTHIGACSVARLQKEKTHVVPPPPPLGCGGDWLRPVSVWRG